MTVGAPCIFLITQVISNTLFMLCLSGNNLTSVIVVFTLLLRYPVDSSIIDIHNEQTLNKIYPN